MKVYEEEDFQSSTYGYDLCSIFSYNYVFNMLKTAEDDLIRRGKEAEGEVVDEIQGVTARLKFTRFFLQVLVTVEPRPVISFSVKLSLISKILLRSPLFNFCSETDFKKFPFLCF